jgi:hypothetical protein
MHFPAPGLGSSGADLHQITVRGDVNNRATKRLIHAMDAKVTAGTARRMLFHGIRNAI